MITSTKRQVPDRYMTVKNAADVLGVTTKTVRRMLDRGQLTRYKDPINDYNVFIRTEEVERILSGPRVAD
jgi:predicted site-specific integrase-resolvase